MYEHVTRFIEEIERVGFESAGSLDIALTHAMYQPEVVDTGYRKTLDEYGLEGGRPWGADVESLDLRATLALLTWVHRADHFAEGAMRHRLEDGFVYRILLRLRELDGAWKRPNVITFYHEYDEYGFLSNWYDAPFHFAGNTFPTTEHWMMWQKAQLFGDEETAEAILATGDLDEVKRLGKRVKSCVDAAWREVRIPVMRVGLRQKFSQNARLLNELLSTGAAVLAEAAPNYYLGDVTQQDYGRAKKLYEIADSKGVVQGMVNLGYIYEYGRCGDPDYDMAYRQYAKAAAVAGHFEALYKLGDMYARGHGVDIDLRAALALYDRSLDAAESVVQQAQPAFRIAELISERQSPRWGIPYDPMGALSLYQLAKRGLRVDVAHGYDFYRDRLRQSIVGQDRMRKVLDNPEFWARQEGGQTETDAMDNEASAKPTRATLEDAVWGAAVGDALGVPYEFKRRDAFKCEGMVGHGTHDQPVGTWSDDTALMLATCDSIRKIGHVDTADLLVRFRRWYIDGAYTPDGTVFDVGNATAEALRTGRGLSGEWDNGNGSLMRIAPLAFCGATDDEVRAVSAITHAHPTFTEACVEFVHLLRDVADDSGGTREELRSELAAVPRDEVRSGGYVLDTLLAAKWCFANTDNYRDCVLAAVNLGSDTDTTACVAGALAGTAYGMDAIPAEWLAAMRGADALEATLF